MGDLVIIEEAEAAEVVVGQIGRVEGDLQLIELWLHGRSRHTQRAYRGDVERMLAFVGKGLREIGLLDLQRYADHMVSAKLAPATRARAVNAVRSLLAFGQRSGYLRYNVGAAQRTPKIKNTLAERILSVEEVRAILHAAAATPRNHVLLRLLYGAGLRVSEICGLRWRDARPRGDAGQLTVFGKGGKTRIVVLGAGLWRALLGLRGDAGDDAPVFRSQKGGALDVSRALRIVKAAALQAEVATYRDEQGILHTRVSPHWLRHAHATHALAAGAPLNLVKDTLGHSSIAITDMYLHVAPEHSSAQYIAA